VFDLAADPGVCVRFNRHAVYLGDPGATEDCPAHAVGRTEAILVQPLAARPARAGAAGPTLPPVTAGGAGSQTVVPVPAHGVVVTATWAGQPAIVARALGLARVRPGSVAAPRLQAIAWARVDAVHAAQAGEIFTGLGFDACSAPSLGRMAAWLDSPYRAVGIYLGGANLACAQPNLTPAWVSAESQVGWHLIPTYVGLQAPTNSCGCAAIRPAVAAAQGSAAATDAIARARALAIAAGNPIYYDMEFYPRTAANRTAVLRFLSAWTATLHAAGYSSGVYGNDDSVIADLAGAMGSAVQEPDDIWFAHWNGVQSTGDAYVSPGDWASHQRLHQYAGGHDARYGGVRINIDSNYVDAATATAAPLPADGTFVEVAGSQPVFRIAGGAPLYISDWSTVGGPQVPTVVTPGVFDLLNPVPADGTFLATADGEVYRVAGGAPIAVSDWSVFGGPQPYVIIDPWNIDNVGDPMAHLNPTPADGTVVEGLPSATYWVFADGVRHPAAASADAIQVDDLGLESFPFDPTPLPVPSCLVPTVRRLTLAQATAALHRSDCALGAVRRPARVRHPHVLHVVRQSPKAGAQRAAGSAVGVTLG
jgi:hypothetical protein